MKTRTARHGLSWTLSVSLTIVVAPCLAQDRDSWQQPDRVMDAIGVGPGMTIGDIGAGDGYFTVKFARRVGPNGRIYANDIRPEALHRIDSLCRGEGITNVETVLGEVDDPLLPEAALDLAFMSLVFHMLERPVDLLERLKPSLKHGAPVVILEFKPERIRTGPYPDNERIVELAAEAGFRLIRMEHFLDRADIYVFTLHR